MDKRKPPRIPYAVPGRTLRPVLRLDGLPPLARETTCATSAAEIRAVPNAAVYEVVSRDGSAHFLKVRFGPVHEPGLLVPRALIDLGVRNVLVPLRTRSSNLWCPLGGYPGYSVVLYPFVRGESAMVAGLSDDQWREFGSTLRDVHASNLGEHLRGRLPVETFSLPSAALVRRLLTLVGETGFESAAAARLAAFWREHDEQIRRMLARAEALGRSLRPRPFEYVLCHADIHAANVLVGDDGRIHLIDWDGPLIAPRERDLLFVIGSKIARAEETDLAISFFAPGGMLDSVETVPARRLPTTPPDPP